MAEILYHKQGVFGPKLEMHIAPEGLTLIGRGGRDSAEFMPLRDVTDAIVKKFRRTADLTIMFSQQSSWVLYNLPPLSAEWAAALINEEKTALEKHGRAEYSQKMPVEALSSNCAKIISAGNSHAAVNIADFLLVQAVLHEASDVHFDPYSDSVVVRFRLNGVLQDVAKLDGSIKKQLTSRLKVVSHLATFKKTVAQEGRAALKIGERTADFRFASIPTIHGEKIAVRVFDPAKSIFEIKEIGMTPDMEQTFQKLLIQPQGTILLTGPAGSGKTTTMYAALSYLREQKKNLSSIATVEDPVEYDLRVVNQTQVNNTTGLTFANALRTVLRQDPEVIMIGEIRDQETADIAVQAGLTGHLILSTVHARSAAGVLLRLSNLGVEPYLLASSVTAILSQRLVRTVCRNCAKDYTPTPEETANFSLSLSEKFVMGTGCEKCAGTGYANRTAIFQLVQISDDMRDMILRRCSLTELEEQMQRENVKSLYQDGLEKARAGITTLEELTRVLG